MLETADQISRRTIPARHGSCANSKRDRHTLASFRNLSRRQRPKSLGCRRQLRLRLDTEAALADETIVGERITERKDQATIIVYVARVFSSMLTITATSRIDDLAMAWSMT